MNNKYLSFILKEDIKNSKNIYQNSETLSNHISKNILQSIKEQLAHQGLKVYLEFEKESG